MRQDLTYVTFTRGKEGLTVVTSDAVALQELMGISGDRQSASELASRAAAIKARGMGGDEHAIYQYFQQQHERPPLQQRPEMSREVTQNVERHTGRSISF